MCVFFYCPHYGSNLGPPGSILIPQNKKVVMLMIEINGVEITYDKVMAVLALFTATCVAVGWVLKIIKGLRKPSEDTKAKLEVVEDRLDNDNKRLKELENQSKYISNAIGVLMRCDLVILSHLRTNNNTGKMAEMEQEITDFLVNR